MNGGCVQVRENDINQKDESGEDGGHEGGDECWEKEDDGEGCLLFVYPVSCVVLWLYRVVVWYTYDNNLVNNMLPTRSSTDEKRSKTHYNHGTDPLHNPGDELDGAHEGLGDC